MRGSGTSSKNFIRDSDDESSDDDLEGGEIAVVDKNASNNNLNTSLGTGSTGTRSIITVFHAGKVTH